MTTEIDISEKACERAAKDCIRTANAIYRDGDIGACANASKRAAALSRHASKEQK